MKRRQFLVMASMATALVHPTPTIACFGDPDAKPSSRTRWIALKTSLQQPHFYYVANSMVVFVPPVFLATHQHSIAAEILSVTPLNDHTEIHRGLLFSDHDLFDVQFVIADALETGAAVVYSNRRRTFVSKVKLVTVTQACSGGRRFFVSDNFGEDLIVGTLDWVS